MIQKQTVKTSFANIYREPKFSSEMVTQALFLETLDILSEHNNWFKVNQWDGYEGYVHKFYLCNYMNLNEKSLVLTDRFTPIYHSKEDLNVAMVAPFGAELSCQEEDASWFSFALDSINYYYRKNITPQLLPNRESIVKYCSLLIGSPYLWGGKTPFGYDCSGFVQQVFKSIKIFLKRDASQQIEDTRFNSIDISSIEKGDLVFFDFESNGVDHVAIYSGNNEVIHCSGYVKSQSIDDGLKEYIVDIKSIEDEVSE